jgi:TPP-dependent pyruvate/acetoin dehydrogenase alpha subunit
MVKAKKPASTRAAKNSNGGSPIPHEKLQQRYTTILKRRATRSAITGHEAAEAGCTIDLRPKDLVLSRRQQKGGLGAAVKASRKMKKTGNVVVVFSCTSDHGDWYEALRIAGAGALPILFVHCDQLSPDKHGRAKEELGAQAESYGFPGIPVDGHDLVALYRVAHESLVRARRGGGPTLIECKPYRLRARNRSLRSLHARSSLSRSRSN